MAESIDKDYLLETCAFAGKVMLENGAEMFRIEDTMNRIAMNHHNQVGKSFVTQTVVIMGLDSTKSIHMERIKERTTNLGKVSQVNDLSWLFSRDMISIEHLNAELRKIHNDKTPKTILWNVFWAMIISASLMILLGGTWVDFIPTCIVGAGGWLVYELSTKYLRLKYVDEFVGAFSMGILAFFMIKLGWGHSLDDMIIGSIMPLVPGVALTNTVRDLQEGHMLSGVCRGVEALIIALMIGAGITLAFSVMGW
ncbi:threonine/serine exporter family protein [Vagococcus coleopterorum]|uniref:Threonine/serine exporter family protein n=1 Tax=Vagococcus coleopterorum TaxID=2714946 RepID=A0A6G8AN54_9ENTE|nr:threonine/serine exporter family protein [Vagococcus coleopterorum]QIL46372.1 threonine/serine exporter family protein [Vagococcus coleopterorum]